MSSFKALQRLPGTKISSIGRISSGPLARCSLFPLHKDAVSKHMTKASGNHVSLRHQSTTSSSPKPSSEGKVICDLQPVPSASDANQSGVYATITINNSSRLNSMNSDLIAQLTSELRTLSTNTHLRATIIKGAHPASSTKTPAFTSGADIYEMSSITNATDAKAFISSLAALCEALRTLPCLTLAQIHGLCLGGGLELAACADFRHASKASRFSMPETKYGIPSVIHARVLVELVGWQRAREMVYLAKFYEADTMAEWGLVDKVCEDEEDLERESREFVKAVAAHGGKAMRVQKELIRTWQEKGFEDGVQRGVDSFAEMWWDGGVEPNRYMREFTDRKKNSTV